MLDVGLRKSSLIGLILRAVINMAVEDTDDEKVAADKLYNFLKKYNNPRGEALGTRGRQMLFKEVAELMLQIEHEIHKAICPNCSDETKH